MSCSDQTLQTRATVRTDEATVFVALELSHSTWLVAASLPGSDKMSKHGLKAGDGPGLLALLARFKAQAERQVGGPVRIVTIQEAGLDGCWRPTAWTARWSTRPRSRSAAGGGGPRPTASMSRACCAR